MNKNYLAGFIDGEGCISVHQVGIARKKLSNGEIREYFKGYGLTIVIVSAHKQVLEEIQKVFGGKIYNRKDGRSEKHHNTYCLSYHTLQSIYNLLKTIYPYLIIKRKQAKIAIKYCKSRLKKIKRRGQAFKYTSKEIQLMKELKQVQIDSSFKAKSYTHIPFSDR